MLYISGLRKKCTINEVESFFKCIHQRILFEVHRRYYNYSKTQQLPYNNGSENGSLPGENRWANQQTDKLVELWKENIVLIESSRSY